MNDYDAEKEAMKREAERLMQQAAELFSEHCKLMTLAQQKYDRCEALKAQARILLGEKPSFGHSQRHIDEDDPYAGSGGWRPS